MKKLFISLFIMAFAASIVKANDADLFSYNRSALEIAIAPISNVENFVAQNPSLSVTELVNTGVELFNGVGTTGSPFGLNEPLPLGCPAFLWGCIFSVSGLIVVYIMTDNDREQVKKAFTGCMVSAVVTIALYTIVLVASAGNTTTTTTPYYY